MVRASGNMLKILPIEAPQQSVEEPEEYVYKNAPQYSVHLI